MGILSDLSMTIDLYNYSSDVNKKKGIKNKIARFIEKQRIKKTINDIANVRLLKNTFVEEFMFMYNSTKDNIQIENLTSGYNSDNEIVYIKFKNRESELTLSTNHADPDRITIKFSASETDYPTIFNVVYGIRYEGTDAKRIAIVNYAKDAIRQFIIEYFMMRLRK